ncbi:hypothetical protein CBL_05427 [Carabus blaptoides fortunei]
MFPFVFSHSASPMPTHERDLYLFCCPVSAKVVAAAVLGTAPCPPGAPASPAARRVFNALSRSLWRDRNSCPYSHGASHASLASTYIHEVLRRNRASGNGSLLLLETRTLSNTRLAYCSLYMYVTAVADIDSFVFGRHHAVYTRLSWTVIGLSVIY